MNLLIILVSSVFVLLLVYIFTTQLKIKKLTILSAVLKMSNDKYSKELGTLTEQYRQLAKINEALRSIQTKRSKK